MPDFGELANQAKNFIGEHDAQSDEALDKAVEFIGEKTGNKYDGQIQSGEAKLEGFLGVEDQDQPSQGR